MRFLWLFLLMHINLQAQNTFKFVTNTDKIEIPFKFISNLIIVEAEVNNVKLNLIFDTGVKQTVLINLKSPDSINLKNLKTKMFSGIGKEKIGIDGLSSRHNKINLSYKIQNTDATFYIITGVEFHFSESIGFNINGFIGGELIKDYLVKIDYKHHKLIFYKPALFDYNKLKRYHHYPLEIINDKPYIYAQIQNRKKSAVTKPLKFLLDTGNSDNIWLLTPKNLEMTHTQKSVRDYFGLGFSGSIEGKRTKIYKFIFDKKYKFKYVYLGLPDSIYFSHIIAKNPFDGLIGNEILRRFFVWFDYKNKRIYLKKYHKNYGARFVFNDIGLNLIYDGKIPVKVKKVVTEFDSRSSNENTTVYTEESYVYRYKIVDRFVINYIRKDSPADKAGLMKGDILLKIDDVNIYQYRLDELEKKFFYHNRKHLNFLIKRKGLILSFNVTNSTQL